MDTAVTAYLLAREEDPDNANSYAARGDLRAWSIVLLAFIWALMPLLLLGTLP